ncbi:menaquinone-dependent protoporphyrinogen IX dehydrogenase [Celerinatantimonas sp. YJH-8]|uniref:menaquinone-dependent protoporphyrinogen IX dehydrogenase n=1 Tax=Celerinatantimonas sp. YJH-8 TaxID=3228714 RepID=UPI0038C4A625
MSILIGYSSCEGQSYKIAQHIAKQLSGEPIKWFCLDHPEQWLEATAEDKILLVASIRYGVFRPALHRYIRRFEDRLQSIPSAFVGVCLTARKPGKDDPERSVYMIHLAKKHHWQPSIRRMFAGALQYSRYNWWQTKLIQLIMKITGGSIDTSVDIEFTDWNKVDTFALELKQLFR